MSVDLNQTVTIGDKEYTLEQLQEVVSKYPELEKSYKKLESEFTKTSQSKKELEAQLEQLKPWGEFDAFVRANPTLAKQINDVVEAYASGQQVSQTNMNAISKAIDKAEKSGDDELVKRLEALEAQLQERQIEDTLQSLTKRAEKDGLDEFTLDGFQEYASKWLEEELGIGDDDDVSPKELRLAYTAYKAHLLETKSKRDKVPNVKSDAAAPPSSKKEEKPKHWKDRFKEAAEYLQKNL
jgi:vacuolar-type H+-ATPase subunit I/STV1